MSVKTTRPGPTPSLSGRPPKGKAKPRPDLDVTPPAQPVSRAWIWAAGFGALLLAALIAYSPALRGEFVFDDVHMPFAIPHAERLALRAWISGARPLTGLTYWLDFQLAGTHSLTYHLTNILLHAIAALMVFLILRKVLELASIDLRRRTLVAGFCSAIFLLHPVQTEAVAYVSGQAESLSVALAFAAWVCFLYRPEAAIGLRTVLVVLLLFGTACGGKEHVAVLPLVLLLTDYYWNPGFSLKGALRNWRLYAPLVILGAIVGPFLYSYLAHEPTIGFHMKEFTPYQYLLTQCRVLFLYLRLFLFPFGQTADYAIDLSHTPLEHGAIVGMLALVAAAVAAIVWRKRFRIASFGFFVALIFFLPTSSIMPIRDLAVERRLYLPMIGLLLIAAEVLVRLRWSERRLVAALASIVVVAGALTWDRSHVWTNSLALWSDTVEKTPHKPRPHLGLGTAEFTAGRFDDAIREYQLADGPQYAKDGTFYRQWALALLKAGHVKEALAMGQRAVQLDPSAPTYQVAGEAAAYNGDVAQALDLLDKAEKSDPAYEPIYIDRGNILRAVDRNREACAAYQKAWTLDPQDLSAAKGLAVCAGPH